jgi:hypothetical protein
MTCPYWSIARYIYRHAVDLDLGLVDEPSIIWLWRVKRAASASRGVNRCTHR